MDATRAQHSTTRASLESLAQTLKDSKDRRQSLRESVSSLEDELLTHQSNADRATKELDILFDKYAEDLDPDIHADKFDAQCNTLQNTITVSRGAYETATVAIQTLKNDERQNEIDEARNETDIRTLRAELADIEETLSQSDTRWKQSVDSSSQLARRISAIDEMMRTLASELASES